VNKVHAVEEYQRGREKRAMWVRVSLFLAFENDQRREKRENSSWERGRGGEESNALRLPRRFRLVGAWEDRKGEKGMKGEGLVLRSIIVLGANRGKKGKKKKMQNGGGERERSSSARKRRPPSRTRDCALVGEREKKKKKKN